MGFNFYFAGYCGKDIHEVFMKYKSKRLMSYYSERKGIQEWLELGQPLLMDSGAFTAYTKGVEIDLDTYIQYCNSLGDSINYFIELDKIPGKFGQPKTPEQLAEATKISWENYLTMLDKLDHPEKCLPVFHRGEPWEHLYRMIDFKPPSDYICLAPIVGTAMNEKEAWLFEAYEHIKKSSNPNIKTHILGMTSIKLLERLPAYSADSTTWIYGGKTGIIETNWGRIYISDKGKHRPDYFGNMPEADRILLTKLIEEKGFSIEELDKDYKKRWEWNIYYFQNWADNYVYKPSNLKQNKLF